MIYPGPNLENKGINAASDIGQKQQFFWKEKGRQKFHHPLYNPSYKFSIKIKLCMIFTKGSIVRLPDA